MDLKKNLHYVNKHGKQLRDFILGRTPELWEIACQWSAIKYHIRAGKKDGESKEKDLSKRDDYIEELLKFDITNYQDKETVIGWLNEMKEGFEEFQG